MDIEDSSVPYRAFLRSGSYPGLTQRVIRSGSVLAQAAGWFALIVTAASAGYTLTQRMQPMAATTGSPSVVRPAARPVVQSALGALPSLALQPAEDVSVPEGVVSAERFPAAERAPVRKRTGAVLAAQTKEEPEPTDETMVQPAKPTQPEPVALTLPETVPQAAPVPPPVLPAPDPIEAVLRDSIERQRAAALALKAATREVAVAFDPAPLPKPDLVAPTLPLTASMRVGGVSVRGPLSAAQLRRSVERVKPALTECYVESTRRAGQREATQVRVGVTIDEAGRVKSLPEVSGTQLPGFAGCLTSALARLVCQAPDTGTAKAQLTLGFSQ